MVVVLVLVALVKLLEPAVDAVVPSHVRLIVMVTVVLEAAAALVLRKLVDVVEAAEVLADTMVDDVNVPALVVEEVLVLAVMIMLMLDMLEAIVLIVAVGVPVFALLVLEVMELLTVGDSVLMVEALVLIVLELLAVLLVLVVVMDMLL